MTRTLGKVATSMVKAGVKPATRRNREGEILEAATAVFSQRGYSAASLQEIADRVGILKGSLYHYIDSKESLLFRILQSSHEDATEIMNAVDSLNLSTEEKFRVYVHKQVTLYLTHLERASLYQNEWRFLEGEFGERIQTHRRAFSLYMKGLIDAAVEDGLASPDLDTALATRFILSAIDSIPSWYRTTPPKRIDDVAASITELAHSTVFLRRSS